MFESYLAFCVGNEGRDGVVMHTQLVDTEANKAEVFLAVAE
jgi:hypothetical protein